MTGDGGLWQAVADLTREMPAPHVERLARRIESGAAADVRNFRVAGDVEAALYAAWRASPVPGPVLAGALRGAVAAAEDLRRRESVELVWTGPTTPAISLRRTEAVLVQVVREAREKVVLVSFVAYEVPSVVEALRAAVARGVHVEIVLEAPAAMGGRVDVDSPAKMRAAVPQASLLVWGEPTDEGDLRGAVHAKCAVADGAVAFVTSANLTSAAMWRNMELGVLIRGGRQPRRLAEHLQALKDRRVFEPA